jgi:hypothetical protein
VVDAGIPLGEKREKHATPVVTQKDGKASLVAVNPGNPPELGGNNGGRNRPRGDHGSSLRILLLCCGGLGDGQAAMVALKRGMASLAAVHAAPPPHRGLREDGDPMATQTMVKAFSWVENAVTSPHGVV